MIVIRLTQKLLKDMKIDPLEVDIVAPLFSWHCNILILNRKKHILFINDFSRLSVIIDGVRSSQPKVLKEKFLSVLNTYLVQEGIDRRIIDSYIRDGQEMVISKTNNRSVLGTMKEISFHSTDTHLEFSNNIELISWLNRLIYKPIDYYKPNDVFKEALKKHYV